MSRQTPCPSDVDGPTAADSADAERLRIGGFVPLTTIDYPGELAAVVFLQGCAWRCRYCQNGALIDPGATPVIAWPTIREILKRRRGLLDAAVFSGGEPTLQSALAAAMTEVRELGFKVGLHTAGPAPKRLERLLPLLDWVALDIKALPEDYPAITGIPRSGEAAWESLSLIQASGVPLEVRTTTMPQWTARDLATLAALLAQKGVRRYAVQACETRNALDPLLTQPAIPLAQLAAAIDPASFEGFLLRGH
ncbi:anaerobic ribonucleoside-triphosphate reductase activating protein [Thiocapsa bogorovii]|uniref:anaerobic ribonucleoside-triphosphate reductase activating protein n=1 Tax=Thiocapsa bogorovii TaxID=521689 RepID=UPI001E42E1D5|nr:anaerobic ribonucleoside-triphosphate reductase activating protein [Thiocapsa bogorovii]UHD18295.1 anaerobic ribonucleoside-triphosphate reductase activating protein [Thiocapsa bogorovii]